MSQEPPRLFLITPPLDGSPGLAAALASAMSTGEVACVRADVAHGAADPLAAIGAIARIVQDRGAALLVCDAALVGPAGADGQHVRSGGEAQEAALAAAISRFKPDGIVGAGLIRTRHEAMTAGEKDIDYLMFSDPSDDGWVSPAQTTLERVVWWAEILNVPCVAFAGSLDEVAPALAAAGADFIALREAVLVRSARPAAAVRDAADALRAHSVPAA